MKFGVIGVGGMGRYHATDMLKSEDAILVAVADVNEEAVRNVAQETGAKAFTDYKELIRKGGVEAVLIATPHYFHPPIAEYAARQGVHVLSEKPIAVTVAAADKMVETCRDKGVKLGVVFQQRTDPSRLKMRQMVADGVIGDLHRVSMVVPWYRTQAYYDSGAWRGTWKGEGGGVLMNQAPHSIDQFIWIGGMPRAVQGFATTRLHDIEVENTALAMMDYGSNKLGWLYVSTAEIVGSGERFEVAGDRGILSWEGGRLRHLELEEPLSEHVRTAGPFETPKGQWHEIEITDLTPPSHSVVVKAFARAVHENDDSLMVATGEDGLRAVELCNAMLLAGYTRQEVHLPLERGRFERMLKKLISGVPPAELYRGKK